MTRLLHAIRETALRYIEDWRYSTTWNMRAVCPLFLAIAPAVFVVEWRAAARERKP